MIKLHDMAYRKGLEILGRLSVHLPYNTLWLHDGVYIDTDQQIGKFVYNYDIVITISDNNEIAYTLYTGGYHEKGKPLVALGRVIRTNTRDIGEAVNILNKAIEENKARK